MQIDAFVLTLVYNLNIPVMKRPEQLESMGVLIKEESLQTLEHAVLNNTFVLESLEPFPGYHGENIPLESKRGFLFLITQNPYPVERILRISQNVCGYQHLMFDLSPAEIFIYNNTLNAIRIKDLNDYALIADIQGCFMDQGIKFMKRRLISAGGLIRVNKVFCLERLQDYFYRDLDDELTFYIEIPYHLNWNLFKKVTFSVKNNLDNSNFDAALAFVYLKSIVEFIRIYTKNPSISRLQSIRDKYLEEMVRIQQK